MVGRLPVSVSGVLGDVERDRNEFVGFYEVGGEVAATAVHGGEFRVEALLFGAEQRDAVVEVGCEADAVVEVLDEVFGMFDLDRAEGAVGAFGVPAEAGVVRVRLTVTVLDDLHDHAESAVTAVQGRLQVVVVFDGAFAFDLHLQDRLDLLEGFAVDE